MKLKQGDYLPVSEIKTEQDFNNVIKAAKGAYSFESQAIRTGFNYVQDTYPHGFVCIAERNLVINYETELDEFNNKLTLSQWLERGGVKPETKEWYETGELPPVGSKVILQSIGFTEYNKQVEITYIGDGVGCYREVFDTGLEFTFAAKDTIFKPLKTKADQEREEFVEYCYENYLTEDDREEPNIYKVVFGCMFDDGHRLVTDGE